MYGVSVMLSKSVGRSLVSYIAISKKVMLVRVKGRPFDISLI